MHVELEVGPDLAKVILAGQVEDALEEDLGPAGHAGHDPHILLDGRVGHALDFLLPVRHEGDGPRRGPTEFAPPGEVVDDDGAEVAGERTVVRLLGAARAADNQVPPSVEPGLRDRVHVHREQVLSALIVAAFEGGLRDGDELAPVGGRARGLGVPFDAARPKDVGLAVPDPFDPRLHPVVVAKGHLAAVGLGRGVGRETVLPAECGGRGRLDVMSEPLGLHVERVPAEQVDLVQSLPDEPAEDGVDGHDPVSWGRSGGRRCSSPQSRS